MSPLQAPPELAGHNITAQARSGLRAEIMDLRTLDVWLCQQPITEAEYAALAPEPPFVKSGLGRSAMDIAWFKRSPGAAADGPLATLALGDFVFCHVARPRDFNGLARGDAPTRLLVEKHHVLGFEAGSRVRLTVQADGRVFVQQTIAIDGAGPPPVAGWSAREITLHSPWVCALPYPCEVYFFQNLSSYAGPLDPAQLPPEWSDA
jgi:hypothetical protein